MDEMQSIQERYPKGGKSISCLPFDLTLIEKEDDSFLGFQPLFMLSERVSPGPEPPLLTPSEAADDASDLVIRCVESLLKRGFF